MHHSVRNAVPNSSKSINHIYRYMVDGFATDWEPGFWGYKVFLLLVYHRFREEPNSMRNNWFLRSLQHPGIPCNARDSRVCCGSAVSRHVPPLPAMSRHFPPCPATSRMSRHFLPFPAFHNVLRSPYFPAIPASQTPPATPSKPMKRAYEVGIQ